MPSTELDIDILRDNSVQRFVGRLPDPAELLAWGGSPGVEYAMVAAHNIPEAKELDWQLCRDCASVTIVGPLGAVELIVMAKGTPILGASPANGIRRWQYDPQLCSITGIDQVDPLTEHVLKEADEAEPRLTPNQRAVAAAKRAAAAPAA